MFLYIEHDDYGGYIFIFEKSPIEDVGGRNRDNNFFRPKQEGLMGQVLVSHGVELTQLMSTRASTKIIEVWPGSLTDFKKMFDLKRVRSSAFIKGYLAEIDEL